MDKKIQERKKFSLTKANSESSELTKHKASTKVKRQKKILCNYNDKLRVHTKEVKSDKKINLEWRG